MAQVVDRHAAVVTGHRVDAENPRDGHSGTVGGTTPRSLHPMPERKHSLPSHYDRLDDQITGQVLDAIVVHPRSHGKLYLDGEWNTGSRPPGHRVELGSTATDNQGVYTEQIQRGSAERYTVSYDVWNYRDSPSFAQIILTGEAG